MEIHIKTMITENKYTTMFLALLTMITALSISAVAIYYSVAGLVAIFAAAAVPIMIMGGTLEIAKLVTAVWLHRYWSIATWWLRSYLALSVVVLMFITSMGIFGFLSKAHIEQTSASTESVAQVERLTTEIARQNDVVKRAELKIQQLQTSGTGADANVQAQIDKEQQRIDTAYARIQPAIDEQNKIIGSQAKLYQDELDRIDTAMRTVAGYIDSGDRENYKKAQAIIGVKPDGAFGSASTRAYTAWKDTKNAERQVLLTNIQQATNNPQARAAAAEIKRLRTTVETQIAESNKLINRLRANIGKTDKTADIDAQVDEQNARIKTANESIDTLTEEKYTLETEYRKLEAEVGPIKYIAEFVYGEEADKNMLEKAVTWVIVIIIFVFDPLAVLLLIASQYTFEYHRKQQQEEQEEMPSDNWELYEQARAQAIVDNPGYDSGPWMFRKEEVDNDQPNSESTESDDASTDDSMGDPLPGQTISTDDEGHSSLEQTEVQPDGLTSEQIAEPYINVAPNYEADDGPLTDDQIQQMQDSVQKKSIELLDDLEELNDSEKVRAEEYELKDNTVWAESKSTWKQSHPDETIKQYKQLYIKGIIDKLPWEETTYQQNSEQTASSIWQKLRKE
jgi:hypothetical protein